MHRRHHRTSPLPLLMAGIGADDEYDAAATDNLALFTHATDAGANLHTGARGGGRPRLQSENGRTSGKPRSIGSEKGRSQGGVVPPRFFRIPPSARRVARRRPRPIQLGDAADRLAGGWGGRQHHGAVFRDRDSVLEVGTGAAVHRRLRPVIRQHTDLL